MSAQLLNLGCGKRYHPAWVNIDFSGHWPHVSVADLSKDLSFTDGSCDVVYHSHLLEHFPPEVAERFLRECHRVLIPGGVLRVVVPDLEEITRHYLGRLEAAIGEEAGASADYDWLMLELYDQCVRTRPGGAMKRYLEQADIPNRDFVSSRMGWLRQLPEGVQPLQMQEECKRSSWWHFLRQLICRESMKRLVLGAEYEVLQEGRFRRSGEIHAWMYDRFSLTRLLKATGFVDVRQRDATESAIPDWVSYRLDVEADGAIRKPDSLFMECRKPGRRIA